jgi:hypothetical protein
MAEVAAEPSALIDQRIGQVFPLATQVDATQPASFTNRVVDGLTVTPAGIVRTIGLKIVPASGIFQTIHSEALFVLVRLPTKWLPEGDNAVQVRLRMFAAAGAPDNVTGVDEELAQ